MAAARQRLVLPSTVVVDADGDHRRVDEVGLDVYGGSFWLDGMFDGVDERFVGGGDEAIAARSV